jgi:hypothetical protein
MKTLHKFWWLALVAGGWLLVHGHAHAAEWMRYPKRFSYDVREMAGLRSAQPYERCNYNTRTCEQGLAVNGFRIFVVLDGDDRSKVLQHTACTWNESGSSLCFIYETGESKLFNWGEWKVQSVATEPDAAASAWTGFGGGDF